MIETLFPSAVAVVETDDPPANAALRPEESACVAQAVPKRRREFGAGRACAREALAQFGVDDFPLVTGPDRAPIWPAGFVGSLSHCDGYCAVAVARRTDAVGLGVDVEPLRPLTASVARSVCSDAELRSAAEFPGLSPEYAALAIFSARESAYKCYFPLAGVVLEHADLEIRLGAGGRFDARLTRASLPAAAGARRFEGRIAFDERFVYTGVMLE